ncbi:hypothetical protein GCM10027090_28790 [Sinomonas soli]
MDGVPRAEKAADHRRPHLTEAHETDDAHERTSRYRPNPPHIWGAGGSFTGVQGMMLLWIAGVPKTLPQSAQISARWARIVRDVQRT